MSVTHALMDAVFCDVQTASQRECSMAEGSYRQDAIFSLLKRKMYL